VTELPDERDLMRNVVKTLELGVDVPLVLDTTELDVLEVALKTAPGRCLINSTHLEGGRDKADRVFSLAKQHNAAVIVLTIDEGGMAKTREKKLEVARRIYEIACSEHGLRAEDLVFDALTFTLATGDAEFANSAVETIEGIRQIKQSLPGALASLGMSNLSFGLAPQARPVLNSVMLYHCIQAGLDMAIVNPAQVKPYAEIDAGERELAEDLIFNRREDALQRYIEHFEKVAPQTAGSAEAAAAAEMSPEQRLHWSIVHRHKEGIEADIDLLVQVSDGGTRHEAAVRTLNHVLLPAMKEVGDKFGAGELILPFVLQSAEVMKKAVSHLEQYLERKEGLSKGIVVLATVYGDVHDIGKNLVKTILSNNGYDVIDLGKQVPAETIITRAAEEGATAIGLSALLVSTSRQMPLVVNELHRRKMEIPVLVGGAAINRRFGRRILFTEEGAAYEAGVFYCKDAFEGLETMDQLIADEKRAQLLSRIRMEAEMEIGHGAAKAEGTTVSTVRSSTQAEPIAHPLRWGQRVVAEMPLETVLEHLSINELYRLSWGAKNTHGDDWERLRAEFDGRLAEMSRSALRDGWIVPRGVYGFFPCCSDGDDLVIYDPRTIDSASPDELTRFTCPRQPFGDHLCLADYFAPAASGRVDVVALQVVTIGSRASERTEGLQARGDYSEAYYTHGLAVQAAEAAADYLHDHIRRELGIGPSQGKRYSWGYPAIPNLEEHKKVFQLLPAASSELGMTLSAAYQLIPEQSTAAIIVHHSGAKYYSLGETRVEQLMK
jgi:5-methyltetrahydrofolate--homocysteine methyltransferase